MTDVSVTETSAPAPRKANKPAAKKKVAKKAAKKNGAAADMSKAIAKSWKDPKVAKARAARHGVRVAGKEYRSVKEAFEKLRLPLGSHIAFRGKLKKAGKLDFETDTGRKVGFAIVKE